MSTLGQEEVLEALERALLALEDGDVVVGAQAVADLTAACATAHAEQLQWTAEGARRAQVLHQRCETAALGLRGRLHGELSTAAHSRRAMASYQSADAAR